MGERTGDFTVEGSIYHMMRDRRRAAEVCTAVILALALTACGSSGQTAQKGNDSGSGDQAVSDIGASDGKVLVAYFTAADNSGVDAESSASYSMVDERQKEGFRQLLK